MSVEMPLLPPQLIQIDHESIRPHGGGLARPFTALKRGCPALLAFFARGQGFLADIAPAGHRIHLKPLTATRCPVRFNFDRTFLPGSIVLGTAPRTAPRP